MKQQKLKPPELIGCAWARRPWNSQGVVLAICEPLPSGLASWLRSRNWRLCEYAKDRGQAAVWLIGGNPDELLGWLPEPPSHGSYTSGNYLPF